MSINVMAKITIFLGMVVAFRCFVGICLHWYEKLKDRRHRRESDRRIIAQAKAVGVWDKKPIVLGGRALELKAWEAYKVKREPGESDAHLRWRLTSLEAAMKTNKEGGRGNE